MTVGILTIIKPELDAICREFEIDIVKDRVIDNGDIYFKKSIVSTLTGIRIDIIVYCQGSAGNQHSGIAATKIIQKFRPDFMLLCGIAAGHKDYCKIGDLVIPKIIGDNTTSVFQDAKQSRRYQSIKIEHIVLQNLNVYRLLEDDWMNYLQKIHSGHLNEKEFENSKQKELINLTPAIKDSIIVSADILIRDPTYFEELQKEVHDKIRVGEMEAAGFANACTDRHPPIPWLVVRGISDFGDPNKMDDFHDRAASVAASWLGLFLRNGFESRLFYPTEEKKYLPSSSTDENPKSTPDDDNVVISKTELFKLLKNVSSEINKKIRNED